MWICYFCETNNIDEECPNCGAERKSGRQVLGFLVQPASSGWREVEVVHSHMNAEEITKARLADNFVEYFPWPRLGR